MNLTYFEKSFLLGISNPQKKKDKSIKKFNPYVVRLFHTLLQKVEMDPHRQWTHDLLRNYVNATYIFCIKLNKFFANKGQQKAINYYEGNSECLRVLFTGLYTPETYQGLKNGLYFVATRKDVNSQWDLSVMTRKDIVDERNNVTWKNELENILNTHILYSNKLNQNTFNIDIGLNENDNIGKLVLSNNSIYNSIPINIRLTVLGNNPDEGYILTMQEGPSSNSDSKYIETYKINKLNINAIIYSYNEKMETNFLAIEFVYKDIFYEFIGSNITKEELINFINTLQ